MKNILFAASECVPFIKTGGLADVVGSLPKDFDKEKYDVRVVIPNYMCMKQEWKEKLEYVAHFYMYLLLCLIPRSSSCIIPDIVRQNSSMKNLCSSHVLRSYSSHVFCHNKFFPHNELY